RPGGDGGAVFRAGREAHGCDGIDRACPARPRPEASPAPGGGREPHVAPRGRKELAMDTENDFKDDGVIDIKAALDREVARRFDGDRIATEHARTIELVRAGRVGTGARHVEEGLSGAGAGPFSRVPVPLQWVGIAAAIVAAAAGVWSFYRDWRSPQPAP